MRQKKSENVKSGGRNGIFRQEILPPREHGVNKHRGEGESRILEKNTLTDQLWSKAENMLY